MNILIVDDAKTTQYIFAKYLKEFGYPDVFTASNIEEAKNVLKVKPIQLIISDLHMPDGSGIELLQYIRTTPEFATIPFIIITSDQNKKYIYEAAKYHLQSYLIKPIPKSLLYQKLQDLIQSHTIAAPPKLHIESNAAT